MGCLILCYFGLKLLEPLAFRPGRRSRFGRTKLRAELLGYDVRLHKAADLHHWRRHGRVSPAASASTSTPSSTRTWFALNFAAEIIMWTLIGGLGTLVGPMIGCIGLLMLKFEIGQQQITNTYLIFGGIIMVFVLAVPAGLLPTARMLAERILPGAGFGGPGGGGRQEAAR